MPRADDLKRSANIRCDEPDFTVAVDGAHWQVVEAGTGDEAVELVQIVYRMDGVPGRHGLRRQHPLPDPTEDADSFWEGQAYQDVWDILEPHDIDDTVTSGGIRWYGHVTEDDNLDARGRPFPLAPPPENASY